MRSDGPTVLLFVPTAINDNFGHFLVEFKKALIGLYKGSTCTTVDPFTSTLNISPENVSYKAILFLYVF